MIKVGLTGGIGSGKSTVSNYLRKKNIPVIDADDISREIYSLYPEITETIKKVFGEKYFDSNGELNRRKLGKTIFKFKGKRKKLEKIVIPYIKKEIFNRINNLELKKNHICILDAPTLIENNLHKKMDINILVYVDLSTQIKRVMDRDKLTYEEVKQRIDSQISLKKKKKKVQYFIDNGGDLEDTYKKVEEILLELKTYKKHLGSGDKA